MKHPILLIATVALAAGLVPAVASAQSGWTYLRCNKTFYNAHPSATVRPRQPARHDESISRISTNPARWQGLSGGATPTWGADLCSLVEVNRCVVVGDEVQILGEGRMTGVNLRTLQFTYSRLDRSARTWGEGSCQRIADPLGGR
ncbi:hypothetical protein [uncultured Brevundimonas sp.]|uniref:hypothetical protein n=1 Tax=uncultured Brevundimonas sp. TaxID=213418 RepID=UPI0030EB47C3|tara:strand:+ start:104386 stop:104820 length:435 start_codon:yes stop_codon:yes gene_type:complete